MKVTMHKYDKDGKKIQNADPGFTSNHKILSTLMNFDSVYKEHHDKIVDYFVAFNANGSGWILDRVNSVSLHMAQFTTGKATTAQATTYYDSDSDMLVYSTEQETEKKLCTREAGPTMLAPTELDKVSRYTITLTHQHSP